MTTVAFLLLKHAAENREHWLQRFYEIEKEAVDTPSMHGFVIRGNTAGAVQLVDTLIRGGVLVSRVEAMTNKRADVNVGDCLISPDQPYFSFAKALLERQKYPDLRDQTGRPIAPYDVTAHTLPLLMGVTVTEITYPLSPGLRLTRLTQSPIVYTAYPPLTDREGRLNDFARIMQAKVGLYKSHVPA